MANSEVAAQAGSNSADSVEKNFKEGKRDLTSVFDEINSACKDESTFQDYTKSFSSRLNDGSNDIAELRGFELVGMDNEGDAVFKNSKGARVQYDAEGNRVEQWGKDENDREFTINEDGSASHKVKPGETVWAIAKDVCRARIGGGDVAVSNAEVAAEVKRIEEANKPPKGKIADINKISPDQEIIVPAVSVKEVKAARGESHVVGKDGKVSEITYPDGRSTTIERDEKGASKIVQTGPEGKTEYVRNEDGSWNVTEPGKEPRKYPGTIEVSDNGTITRKNTETCENTTEYPNGTVVVEKGEEKKVTTPDGSVYNKTAEVAQQNSAQADTGKRLESMHNWLLTPKGEGDNKKSVFQKIDADGNGFVDADEINSYKSAHSADRTGEDADRLTKEQEAYLTELAAKEDTIENYHDDDGWDDFNGGITTGDLSDWTKAEVTQDNQKAERKQVVAGAQELLNQDAFFLTVAEGRGFITETDLMAYIDKRKAQGLAEDSDEAKQLEIVRQHVVRNGNIQIDKRELKVD